MRFSTALSVAAVLGLAPAVLGHTWVGEMQVIDSTGAFTGAPGFPRNWEERSGDFDKKVQYKVTALGVDDGPAFNDETPMCKHPIGQSPNFPGLKASPGDMVVLRYAENGHVSFQDLGKPKSGGVVLIYGTVDPKPDDKLKAIWKTWTADGKGGDGRGFLLATRKYDDGQCHEPKGVRDSAIVNERKAKDTPFLDKPEDNPNHLCQNDITLPDTLKPGQKFTIYWVWDYSTMKVADAPMIVENPVALEIYTSCMDIEIVEGPGTSKNFAYSAKNPLQAGIESQLKNPFDVEFPEWGAVKGATSPKLPGPLPDQENAKERVPNDGASQVPDGSAPAPEQPKPEQKPTPSAQPSAPAPVKSEAPKATDAKPPGQGDFVPGMGPGPTATETVTVSIPGPTSFKTVYVGVSVGQTLTAGEEPAAPATSGAQSPSGSASVTSSASSISQASPQASAGAGGSRPNVEPFMNVASIVTPTTPPSSTPSSLPSSSSLVADTTTASPPVSATTFAPSSLPVDEDVQVITEEATITTYETIVTSFVKPSATSLAAALPTLDAAQTQGGNGTGVISGRSGHFKAHKAKELPRFRRLKRAL